MYRESKHERSRSSEPSSHASLSSKSSSPLGLGMAASARSRSLYKISILYSKVGRGFMNRNNRIEIQGQACDFKYSLERNGMPTSRSASWMPVSISLSSPVHRRSTSTAAASSRVATGEMWQSLQVENPCRYSALQSGQNIVEQEPTTN